MIHKTLGLRRSQTSPRGAGWEPEKRLSQWIEHLGIYKIGCTLTAMHLLLPLPWMAHLHAASPLCTLSKCQSPIRFPSLRSRCLREEMLYSTSRDAFMRQSAIVVGCYQGEVLVAQGPQLKTQHLVTKAAMVNARGPGATSTRSLPYSFSHILYFSLTHTHWFTHIVVFILFYTSPSFRFFSK